jgi:RNA polymerase sigma-70 factor (ECF subfamily)
MTVAYVPTREYPRLPRPPPRPETPSRTTGFDAELVKLQPNMRAFARSLCGNHATADDLVQGTILSALANSTSYLPGSNMRAWLFTILRNTYFSQLRKRRREVEDANGKYTEALATEPTQDDIVDLHDTMRAVSRLSRGHRQVLMMVGRDGLTYDEAALDSGCAVGTIKSRTHRARGRLADLLS